jgi:hypothetical protein
MNGIENTLCDLDRTNAVQEHMYFTLERSTVGIGDKSAKEAGGGGRKYHKCFVSGIVGCDEKQIKTGYYILVIEDIGGNGCVSKSWTIQMPTSMALNK